ncbi:MAG TPA: GntR family transcriptional regulator [Sphaerochaeta sp.]|jgi:DNA-binding GntR family transcriptional regulator|nr:GntR family transcriptional regulator [Spirochaetales bacterium]HKM08642.1 GntR family transcriptional regulator [Sphaerochaeta sp.]
MTSTNNLKTSSEKAYQALLREILGGSLPKGEFLSQRMLAELADTSIISVREALKRLEYEYLLESVPKWGVRIPVETRARIKDLYGIREALEVMVAYLLCKKNDQEVGQELIRLADEVDSIDTGVFGNLEVLAKKHRELHLLMAQNTGNQQLVTELKRLSLWSLLYQDPKRIWEVKQENWDHWHKNLVEEIFSNDPNRAQAAMHKHIQHGLEGDLIKFDKGFFD